MITTGVPTRKIMHKNALLNCTFIHLFNNNTNCTILTKPFPVERQPQLMHSACLKKTNLPEVTANNMQRNGSHLNFHHLEITLGI
jgi:hypothetical protein